MYRQGDVLVVGVEHAPPPARDREGGIGIANGPVAGRVHAVVGPGVEVYLSKGTTYVRVPVSAVLTHPDHAPIPLPAGHYRVVRRRQYVTGQATSIGD